MQVESWDASLLFVHVYFTVFQKFLFDPMLMFLKKVYLATLIIFTTLLRSFLYFDLADSLCDLFAD